MNAMELIGLATIIYAGLRMLTGLINMVDEVKEQDRKDGRR